MYGSNINLYPLHDLYIDIVWNEHSELLFFCVIVASKSWGEKIYEECIYNYYFEIK